MFYRESEAIKHNEGLSLCTISKWQVKKNQCRTFDIEWEWAFKNRLYASIYFCKSIWLHELTTVHNIYKTYHVCMWCTITREITVTTFHAEAQATDTQLVICLPRSGDGAQEHEVPEHQTSVTQVLPPRICVFQCASPHDVFVSWLIGSTVIVLQAFACDFTNSQFWT